MKIWAYCIAPAARAVAAATGVRPVTSPPWTADLIRPEMLTGHDLVYLRLHGLPNVPDVWFGEWPDGRLVPALTKGNLDELDPIEGLGGATVVVANCYGAESPLLRELLEAGARAVIAGSGPNVAAGKRVVGPDLLVSWVIRAMRRGMKPRRALRVAKGRLALSAWRSADRDAMRFRLEIRDWRLEKGD